MSWLNTFLKAIPQAASNPMALTAFAIAALLFLFGGFKLVQLQLVLSPLKKRSLKPEQFREAIELALNTKLPQAITAQQWIKHNRQQNGAMLGIAVILALLTVAIVALLRPPPAKADLKVGKDAVVYGNFRSVEAADGAVVVAPTGTNGRTELTQPMALGHDAQAGPGSIAIGHGARAGVQTAVQFAPNAEQAAQFVNSPGAIANFRPTERGLSAQQREALTSKLKQVSNCSVTLRDAGSLESFKYREQFQESFTNAGWKIVRGRFLINEHAGYGVSIMVADMKHPPRGALELQQALEGIGIAAPAFEAPIPPDELDLYVGFQQQTDQMKTRLGREDSDGR